MDKKLWTIVGVVLALFVVLVIIGYDGSVTGEVKSTKTRCNDNIDNDGDGYCDFFTMRTICRDKSIPGDPDCISKEDNNEATECIPRCKSAADCGTPYWGEFFCGPDGDAWGKYMTPVCNAPGSCQSSCTKQVTEQLYELCYERGCVGGQCRPWLNTS